MFNPVTGTNRQYALQDQLIQVEAGYPSSYDDACVNYSLENVSLDYGGWEGCRSVSSINNLLGSPFAYHTSDAYPMQGTQPDWFWLGSQISSKNGSADRYGEPAFGVRVTTYWSVWARSNWNQYFRWECRPEPVVDPGTGLPIIDPITGLPVTQKVCKWHKGGGAGPYVYLGSVLLNYVVLPGAGAQPFYPIAVNQSQPLLTTPGR